MKLQLLSRYPKLVTKDMRGILLTRQSQDPAMYKNLVILSQCIGTEKEMQHVQLTFCSVIELISGSELWRLSPAKGERVVSREKVHLCVWMRFDEGPCLSIRNVG